MLLIDWLRGTPRPTPAPRAQRPPLHPEEIAEQQRDAEHAGYVRRMQQENRELQQAKADLLTAHRVLWALANQSRPVPLRVTRVAMAAAQGPRRRIHTVTDLATGDLLIFAEPER